MHNSNNRNPVNLLNPWLLMRLPTCWAGALCARLSHHTNPRPSWLGAGFVSSHALLRGSMLYPATVRQHACSGMPGSALAATESLSRPWAGSSLRAGSWQQSARRSCYNCCLQAHRQILIRYSIFCFLWGTCTPAPLTGASCPICREK